MHIWGHRGKSIGFYAEAIGFCLLSLIAFFIFQKEKPFSVRKNIFDKKQYLFSQQGVKAIEPFKINTINNLFLSQSSPPFLISGKTLGSLASFSGRREIERYIVKKGDTISSIASKFDISVNTILWANDLSKNSFIKPGKELIILPVSGVLHMVRPGDTLSGIATAYKVSMKKIVDLNGLIDPEDIFAGDLLIIPGAKKPLLVKSYVKASSSKSFICPIPAPCRITQGLHWFNAVDFSNGKCGEPVFAVAGGTIQRTGYTSLGGRYVRIKHLNGVITYYGHLSQIAVRPGQTVHQGQIIGYVGHTGNTRPKGPAGCHVHFDVRFAKNPFASYPVGSQLLKK